ncbi:hypothetical protein AB2B41_18015 [Marimonas sp. MJW-29]|uniref:Uncharacterized protein n=1 Tax=Sulfitobacter sediminis TaxID=3234186 RepID=A0ABV3RRK1_9RHOB
MNRVLFAVVVLLVGAAVIAGLMIVGGPGQARMEQRDRERLDHLRQLAEHERCRLVAKGEAVPDRCRQVIALEDLRDPLTDAAYVTRMVGKTMFEVCAELETDPETLSRYDYARLYIDGQGACLRYRRTGDGADWQQE